MTSPEERFPELSESAVREAVMALPVELRVASAAWVFYALSRTRRDRGTYRYFLDRLELPTESGAYRALMFAGALDIIDALPDLSDESEVP